MLICVLATLALIWVAIAILYVALDDEHYTNAILYKNSKGSEK